MSDHFRRRRRYWRWIGLTCGIAAAALLIARELWWPSPVIVGQIVSDTFTEGSDTTLASHTPDTGTGWTKECASGSIVLDVIASSDTVKADQDGFASNVCYTAQPDPTDAEYDVQATFSVIATDTDSPSGFCARLTDESSNYNAMMYMASVNPDALISKRISGVPAERGTADVGDGAGTVFKCEVRDAAKKWLAGATERISTTDNVITATGRAGLVYGNVHLGTDDVQALIDTNVS